METERTPADVFGLLSDDIRLDILRTVAEAQFEARQTGIGALSFSAIYDRVDVDNTSKLSYHLGELTGTFLRKQDDKYAFTHAGEQLVRFILAENFRQPAAFDPIDTPGTCLYCGARGLRAECEDQFFVIRCRHCDQPAYLYRVTPAQVRTHTNDDLLDAVIWEQAGDFLKMSQEVCPECAGSLETTVVATAEEAVPESVPVEYAIECTCQECLRRLSIPLAYAAAYHPESIAFHWEHGVDIVGTAMWEFHQFVHDGRWNAEQVDSDPVRYQVELQHDSSTLRLVLDDSGDVTRTERVARRDQPRSRS